MSALFAAYFAANGALLMAFQQSIGTSFAYGASSLAKYSFAAHLARIVSVFHIGAPSREWIVILAAVGIVAAPWAAWRARQEPTLRGWIVLLTLHSGLVVFSLMDFQRFGDLFALLYSVAFFAAVATSVIVSHLQRRVAAAPWPALHSAVALTIAALPAFMPAQIVRPLSSQHPELRLDDQRELVQAVVQQAGRDVALLNHTELAILGPLQTRLPFVYWDSAAPHYFTRASAASDEDTLGNILSAAGWPTIVTDAMQPLVGHWTLESCERRLTARNGRYAVRILFHPPTRCQAARLETLKTVDEIR